MDRVHRRRSRPSPVPSAGLPAASPSPSSSTSRSARSDTRTPTCTIHARGVVGSWLYQQLVRVLFRLDVRDTQVGMKLFRREIAEEVIPLLVVKRYAFDLELLAVSRALGFRRIRELPVTLDYQFTGSGVRSLAVLRALVDTAGIFYRLRILRYYQRKQRLLGSADLMQPARSGQRVTVITTDPGRCCGARLALDRHRAGGRARRCRPCARVFSRPTPRSSGSWGTVCVPAVTGCRPRCRT